jgi:hypothetical protein
MCPVYYVNDVTGLHPSCPPFEGEEKYSDSYKLSFVLK